MHSRSWREEYVSQIPALQVLMQLGYEYLPPEEALSLRGGKTNRVLLESVLESQLRKLNSIQFKGKEYEFSDSNIQDAIRDLRDIPLTGGLVSASEVAYDLLTLGVSKEQTIAGDRKSFSMRYIDWDNPENNVFHVTDEFEVEKVKSHELRRPDIVVFVNGIPLVVIECKKPTSGLEGESSVWEAVSQHLRNQRADEIPNLFIYSQVLLSINKNEALYATTDTPKKFWAVWQEESLKQTDVSQVINTPETNDQASRLFGHREPAVRKHFEELRASGERLPTEQDKTLYSLLRPGRLLELIFQYIVYDAGVKKIARYQQYFAIQATLDRVRNLGSDKRRRGGVIWHTTGSGKSLTMVMLVKSLALEPAIKNPKVILVTDRVDLDTQIWRTFKACGKTPVQADSGRHLVELLKKSDDAIITTVIDKFEQAASTRGHVDEDANIFVLVDESHRSQYGSMNAKMEKVFPNACYIGFTGTPLLKKEKSTSAKFGGIIHKYSINQAVKDGAVVPLLYEGRLAVTDVNKKAIDQWFERVTLDLTDDQKGDLKKKFSRAEAVNQAEQRIQQIAYDISEHFTRIFKPNGLKAQLACSSKETAIRYKKFLDEVGLVEAEVVISGPDTREGNEDTDEESIPLVQQFWKKMMERFKSEKSYNTEIVESFKKEGPPDMLIVVDKLLTGFDAPRNTVLYVDKALKEHSLLQAIARVNRLHDDKDFGYIIDYRGILGELDSALNTYGALEGYEEEDLDGTVTAIQEEIGKLPQKHSDLVSLFKEVKNQADTEALEQYLEDELNRKEFYELLSGFAASLKVALSSSSFITDSPEEKIKRYKDDLKFYHNLRASVMRRYSEIVDYSEYENRIKALVNRHISSTEIEELNDPISIFDTEAFEKELQRLKGDKARADTIATRTKKTITENWDKDPAFYKRFSELIEEAFRAYRDKRYTEAQLLEEMRKVQKAIVDKDHSDLPEKLHGKEQASAFFGIVRDIFQNSSIEAGEDILADVGLKVDEIIESHKIVHWTQNQDIQNKMLIEIEDYLFSIKGRHDINLTSEAIDEIMEQVLDTARKRDT